MRGQTVRIVLAGGGTIGHVAPVLAVLDELRRIAQAERFTAELFYIGRRQGVEQSIVEAAQLPYFGISAGKLRRYADFQNLVDPFRVMVGFFESLALLIRLRPDVVFAKGGYVSLPVVIAARVLRIPIVSHETDSILGLSNRWAARVATTLCVSFPLASYAHQPVQASLVQTGNPVRADFFGLRQTTKSTPPYTLVVFGGSQGSLSINRALESLIERPLPDCSIIHLTGPAHFANFAARASTTYHPMSYTDHLADLLAQADLVIARSGGSIFELAAAGRPAILIPLSTSANRHQQSNADYVAAHQAAVVIDESELSAAKLRSTVKQLLDQPARRRSLARQIHALAVPDAATRVAQAILAVVPEGRRQ